jgi:predicted Rossmann-fold nucleotide-binding protein
MDIATVEVIDARVTPRGSLELLSHSEVQALRVGPDARLLELFRRCALAVLNTGSESDDAAAIFARYADFEIEIEQRTRGVKLTVRNAPASAFVDGVMIEGVRHHLFSVLRDIVYQRTEIEGGGRFDLTRSDGITEAVFHILKHARVLQPNRRPNLVVCWGGHAISRTEYEYTKEVGYHLGLRGLDICTGCGPGAMKGPMKGAAIGHAKQRRSSARYIGLTEPGIIAAEPPNPMVSRLVVLPDMEKRLEAFVRLGHAIIVFPGGVGTVEELLYLMGIMMDPANAEMTCPVILTGPPEARDYLQRLDALLTTVFGAAVAGQYEVVVGDAAHVARRAGKKVKIIRAQRRNTGDAFYFNWLLHVGLAYQTPFEVNHSSVAALQISRDLPAHELAANLRRAFSALVTGNIKAHGTRMIEEYGPFHLSGDAVIMNALDSTLGAFVAEGRMKLAGESYRPCYVLERGGG